MRLVALVVLSLVLLYAEAKVIPGFEDGNIQEALRKFIENSKKASPSNKRNTEQDIDDDASSSGKWGKVNKIAKALITGDCGYSVPGISIGVTKGNNVIYKKSYGYANIASKTRMTEDTLFVLCSNTKPFLGAYAAACINAGSITEESKIRDLLNRKWSHVDPFVDFNINVMDGILHRVGWYRADLADAGRDITNVDETIEALQTWPLQYPFRTKFLYNNFAYALTGEAIARSRGTNWPNDVKNLILTPLGMTKSVANYTEALATGKMTTYYTLKADGSLFAYPPNVNGGVAAIPAAASMCSSVNDMTKWLRFQANGGKNIDGVQVIPPELLAYTQTPKIADPAFNMQQPFSPVTLVLSGYAFGWNTGVYRGRNMLFHNGAEAGVMTVVGIIPSENIGVVLLLNLELQFTTFSSLGLLTAAMDAALGISPFVNETTVCSFPCPFYEGCSAVASEQTSNGPTPQQPQTFNPPLSEYVGNYTHPSFGTLYFNSESTKLVFNNGAGLSCYTITQTRDTFSFHCDLNPFFNFPIDSTLYFQRDIETNVNVLNFPFYAWDGVPGTAPFTKQ